MDPIENFDCFEKPKPLNLDKIIEESNIKSDKDKHNAAKQWLKDESILNLKYSNIKDIYEKNIIEEESKYNIVEEDIIMDQKNNILSFPLKSLYQYSQQNWNIYTEDQIFKKFKTTIYSFTFITLQFLTIGVIYLLIEKNVKELVKMLKNYYCGLNIILQYQK